MTPTFLAEVSTGHFTFHAFGESDQDARTLLMTAWATHCEQTGADPEYLSMDDINVYTGTPGTVLRDGSPIHREA